MKVLFVCLGNICRSPTAEGVFAQIVKREGLEDVIVIDSAGTAAYHVGKAPDTRAQEAARRRGVELGHLRARRVTPRDIEEFDVIVAMDEDNLADLTAICPAGNEEKLCLMMDFAPEFGETAVPDPYYGGAAGFERVLDMVERAAENLLNSLRRRI